MGIEGTYLNIIKAIYDTTTANISLTGEKLKKIPTKMKNKTRMSALATTIQHSFGSPSHSNQRRKRNKRNVNWKEVNLSLVADDMILYLENPKDSTRKLFELIREFGEVAGYKINTQKLTAFLTTKDQKEKLGKQSYLPLHQKE